MVWGKVVSDLKIFDIESPKIPKNSGCFMDRDNSEFWGHSKGIGESQKNLKDPQNSI